MKKCKHKRTLHLRWIGGVWCNPVYGVNCVDWISPSDGAVTCRDCGAWLSLGPANDEPAAVRVEIRAAGLAAIWNSNSSEWNGFESLGMVSPEAEHAPLIERDIAEGRKFKRDLDAYYAGHLARHIVDSQSGKGEG